MSGTGVRELPTGIRPEAGRAPSGSTPADPEAQALATLTSRLSRPVTADTVRDALREALADAGLDVLYRIGEPGTPVDGAGARQPVPDPRRNLVVDVAAPDGTPLAVVVADRGLRRSRRLLHAAVEASRPALENARLQASLRAQLVEVNEARVRLLHAALEQRRRLERDLHDGAQQRLLAVGMRLGALEGLAQDRDLHDALRSVRTELHRAIDELRDLAHGLYPAVLSQAGLGPALEAVAERSPVPIDLQVQDRRWPADVEGAAYMVACETLTNAAKHAGARGVRLSATGSAAFLLLEVDDDGRGCAALNEPGSLPALRDRVGALGGTMSVSSRPHHGTRVIARFPCR